MVPGGIRNFDPSKKRNKTYQERCPPFLSIVNASSNNSEPNSVNQQYLLIIKCIDCNFYGLADEEFDELCFQFGIELDEVVNEFVLY